MDDSIPQNIRDEAKRIRLDIYNRLLVSETTENVPAAAVLLALLELYIAVARQYDDMSFPLELLESLEDQLREELGE